MKNMRPPKSVVELFKKGRTFVAVPLSPTFWELADELRLSPTQYTKRIRAIQLDIEGNKKVKYYHIEESSERAQDESKLPKEFNVWAGQQ